MRRKWLFGLFTVITVWPVLSRAESLEKDIKKAVERSTLAQSGTKPFHLKATFAPSFERDKDSGRTGEVEIWWDSPTRWKREVRSPGFHQIQVINGPHIWQENEGNYFPQRLERTATELIEPIPPLEQVLKQARGAETRRIGPMINLSWTTPSGTPEVPNILRGWVALSSNTGLLLYAGGLGWGAEFKDYADFHGKMVARTVNVGSTQLTAKITTLEDLAELPTAFFDSTVPGGDPHSLRTVVMEETFLRKNLLSPGTTSWPSVQDGPLEGKVTTDVVVDCDGKVRDIETVVSDNPALNDAAKQAFLALRFKPFSENGAPVQVISQFTMPFKTSRPAGAEIFDSARGYFERGRHIAFPAFGNGTPYVLRAEFEAQTREGGIAKGRYEDIWLTSTQWRREVDFENGQYVRSRNGEQLYQLVSGDYSSLLRLVMQVMEPIPAIDTFVESDWKIRRDTVNGVRTVRVLAGYVNPEGQLDAESARAYWFNDAGSLVKTYNLGIETERSEFTDFAGVKVAQHIDVIKDGKVGMRIHVTELAPAGNVPTKMFEIKGHEWIRAFTAEAR
jgi:TonB family protein